MIQRIVLPGGLVQVPPTRLVLPGGFTQTPFRPVIAGVASVAPGGSLPFPPIANLVARWESDQIIGLADFDPVDSWPDASGNNHTLSQANPDSQPYYVVSDSDFNNQPAVDFDGTDDVLSVVSGLPETTADMEILLVAKRIGAPTTGWPYTFTRTFAAQGGGITTAGSDLYYLSSDSGTYACQLTWPATAFLDDAVFTNNTADASHQIDNGVPVTGNVGTITDFWTAAMHMAAFREDFGFFPIRIAAMFYIRPAMSAPDKAALRLYISTKYGITV